MAYRGRKYFGFEVVILVNMCNLSDQLQTIIGDVIQSADEGRQVRSACFSSENSLTGREYQGAVSSDAFAVKVFQCFHAVLDHWDLYDDFVVDFREFQSFADHAF